MDFGRAAESSWYTATAPSSPTGTPATTKLPPARARSRRGALSRSDAPRPPPGARPPRAPPPPPARDSRNHETPAGARPLALGRHLALERLETPGGHRPAGVLEHLLGQIHGGAMRVI